MHAILAIDAAWTKKQPSGVALISGITGHWRCIGLAPSYHSFIELSRGRTVDWEAPRISGCTPDCSGLLQAASCLLQGRSVSLVTVDMPLATVPITGRRAADQKISHQFGRAKCSTHSPNASRPGTVGTAISDGFEEQGFSLATTDQKAGTPGCLVEVYPHPALLRLLNAQERIPYKVTKSRRYWPGQSLACRIMRVRQELGRILGALRVAIQDIALPLPDADHLKTLSQLKRYEDAIDALVCGWVGTQFLQGSATAYGDATCAIWVPEPKGLECPSSLRN